MKKQFIAILLTVAMLVAMVPVVALPASAVAGSSSSTTTHTVPFASPDIVMDGKCDDVYQVYNEAPIKSGYIYKDGKYTGEVDLKFEAYSIATMDGIYLWIDIQNETTFYDNNNNTGDYLQFYVDMGQDMADNAYLPYVLLDYHNKPSSGLAGVKTATTRRTDGWTAEIFVPWTAGTPAAKAVSEGRTDFYFGWGIQVNDDRDGNKSRDLIAFDSKDSAGLSYYRYHAYMSKVVFTDDYKVLEDESGNSSSAGFSGTYGFVYTEQSPTMDGKLDYLYSKGSKLVDTAGNRVTGEQFEAYSLATKDGFYVWAKINDNTQFSGNGNSGDYLQIYYNMGSNPKDNSAYGYVQCDYNGAVKVRESSAYGQAKWPSASEAGIKVKISKTSDYWVAEVFHPWRKDSAAGKAMMAGEYQDTYFGLGIQVNNDTDGDKNRNYYCYDSGNGGNYWNDSSSNFGYALLPQIGFIYDDGNPTVPVYEKISFAKTLVLGKALQDAQMVYTFKKGDSVEKIIGERVEVGENKYMFSYDISPEYMGASFTAELVLNDFVFATLADNYRVIDYYNELLEKDSIDLGLSPNQYLAMRNLVYSSLNYGAAAQKYTGFDTENLVNDGVEQFGETFKGINNYEEIYATDALEGYNAELISINMNFNSANKIIIKFKADADTIDKLSVTFSDDTPGVAEKLEIKQVAGEEDTYVAYSPVITPDNYNYQYTVRLVYKDANYNNVVIQKAGFNVNAYLAAKIADPASSFEYVELCKATFLYGKAARSYMAS